MPPKKNTFGYSDTEAAELFESMASGETLRAFCRRKEIPHSTCLKWINKKYRDQYTRARVDLAYFWADEIVDIADDTSKDYNVDSSGKKTVDNEAIQRSRLKVDTRKWLLSKLIPKEFGESLELKGKVDANVTTNLPPEIAEMIANMKKGDEDNECSPVEG